MATTTLTPADGIEIISPASTFTVEVWSDVICPWCWIGLTRLRNALGAFEHAGQVTIVHHSFRLMPGVTPRPVEEVIAAKMGISIREAPAVFRQVEQVAASEGLHYRLAGTLTGDTLDAHRLIKFAQTRGSGQQMLERLYRAYLSEQVSVFERDSLLDLATDVGLDRDEAAAMLDSDGLRADVDEDQRELQALGGNGVPFFLIGGKVGVSGAQPKETFLRALRKGWDARPVELTAGGVCGPDGCAI